MSDVTIRQLRNDGGSVVDRVLSGEHLTVTRNGKAVARLSPLRREPAKIADLIARRRNLAPIDPEKLKAEIDEPIRQLTTVAVPIPE